MCQRSCNQSEILLGFEPHSVGTSIRCITLSNGLTCMLFLIHNEFSFCFEAIISLLKRGKKRIIQAKFCSVVLHKAFLSFSDKLKSCI